VRLWRARHTSARVGRAIAASPLVLLCLFTQRSIIAGTTNGALKG
jgi:hypothetical protein